MMLAQLVLLHRLLPQNPLQQPINVELTPLFDTQASVSTTEQIQALNLLG
jgi:hypothetical protein